MCSFILMDVLDAISDVCAHCCCESSCWFLILSSLVLNRTPSHICEFILTGVPVKGGIVHPYKDGFLGCSGKILPIPAYSIKVVQCSDVACCKLVEIYTLNSAYNEKKYAEILLRYRQLFVKGNVFIGEKGIFGAEVFLHYR